MFSENPFAILSADIAPAVMQGYVAAMIALVAAGTLFDIWHKKSGRYFFANWRGAKKRAKKAVSAGQAVLLAGETVAEALVSGEFCSTRRRIAHLLGMYGFLFYAVATAVMVFGYPAADVPTPAIWPLLWHTGALMVCIGCYWFWFFIRVDVSAEGHSPWRIVRADLFVLSLAISATLALIWSWAQSAGSEWTFVAFGFYLIATTVLFAGVPWSKFAHMFYKPAAAFQKRMAEANGSRAGLPLPAEQPERFGSARTAPRHY